MVKKINGAGNHVIIGDDQFQSLNRFIKKNKYNKFIIICDENSAQHCLPTLLFNCDDLLEAELIEIDSGEENKTLETCMQIWGAFQGMDIDRNTLILNLGGGVITDMGGFIASVYKRGIDFVNIPTTLLAMVDASVGGKNGVDLLSVKNQIGTITQPQLVIINPVFLNTLSERQIKNGMAEILKIAMIQDEEFHKTLSKIKTLKEFTSTEIIFHAVWLKYQVVKQDPTEKHLRKCLNFGHSIGHALESACLDEKKDIFHGEAIAAGMMMESYIAYQLKQCSKSVLNTVEKTIKKYYSQISISTSIEKKLLEHIKHDKKNINGKWMFAIANQIGSFQLIEATNSNLIKESITYYKQLYQVS